MLVNTVGELRWRAKKYGMLSMLLFVCIAVSFVVGFQNFIKAESNFINFSKESGVRFFPHTETIEELISITEKISTIDSLLKQSEEQRSIDTIKKVIDSQEYCSTDCLKSKKAGFERRLKVAQDAIEQRKQNYALSESSKFIDSYLIAGGTTKLGILTLLLFLLITLSRLYQYMARLSSFYSARADAIELLEKFNGEKTIENLEKLSSIMTPTFVILDKDSENLFQKFQDFVTEKFDLMVKDKGGKKETTPETTPPATK